MPCFTCGSDSLENYGAQTVCTQCGTVLEENQIVSEIQFGETSGGAAVVQGSYIGQDQSEHTRQLSISLSFLIADPLSLPQLELELRLATARREEDRRVESRQC